jgi:hypothetical protein
MMKEMFNDCIGLIIHHILKVLINHADEVWCIRGGCIDASNLNNQSSVLQVLFDGVSMHSTKECIFSLARATFTRRYQVKLNTINSIDTTVTVGNNIPIIKHIRRKRSNVESGEGSVAL